jgi:uncharacterized small protein (DUF1192 family)
MNEEEFIKSKNNIELGSNLDALSIDELLEYVEELKNEINRVEKLSKKKHKALDLAKNYFK